MNPFNDPHSSRPAASPNLQAAMIWTILLVSQGLIVAVSQTAMNMGVGGALSAPDQPAASSLGEVPSIVFIAGASIFALAAVVLPRVLIASIGRRLQDRRQDRLSQMNSQEILKAMMPVWIVRWVLLEGILLMGFVSSMLSAQPSAIYPFAGASLVGYLLSFPNERRARQAFMNT